MSDPMDKPPQRRSLQAQIQELDQLIAERRAISIPRSSFNATRRRAENEERLMRLQCARETLAHVARIEDEMLARKGGL